MTEPKFNNIMTPTIRRCASSLIVLAYAWGGVSPALAEPITPHLAETYLHIDPSEVARLEQAQAAGLMEIAPVILPEGDNIIEDNIHFGWPVAAMIDDTIIVYTRRKLGHGLPNNSGSGPFYVRSTDGGQTWSGMIDINPLMPFGQSAGAMATIGTTSDGKFVMAGKGTLVSDDLGATWTHYPTAFGGTSQIADNLGPNMLEHPEFGMMLFNGQADTTPNTYIRVSPNGGQNWQDVVWADSSTLPKEPAAVVFDNNILLISREFDPAMGGADGRYYNMSMSLYTYEEGDTAQDITFTTQRTNIRGNLWAGVWAHDTAGLNYNPVTGRIEMLDSHRYGGGLGETGENQELLRSTLNSWSIDPQDLLSGSTKWRFDGTVMDRNDRQGGDGHLDGLHPGSTVIDQASGMEHVFVYAGGGNISDTPENGIFRISRTLDSTRLRRFLLENYATRWHMGQPISNPGGSSVEDGSGYALPATVVGNPSVTTGDPAYGATEAMTFATGDRLERADGGEEGFFDIDADDGFTFEAVFRTSQHGEAQSPGMLLGKEGSLAEGSWWLAIQDGKPTVQVRDAIADGAHISTVTGADDLSDGDWHHIAVTRVGSLGYIKLYVDQQLVATIEDTTTGDLANASDLIVGNSLSGAWQFLGDIDFINVSREAKHPREFLLPLSQRGDVNFDGLVDQRDVYLIDVALGQSQTDLGNAVGDVNFDGLVDALDRADAVANLGIGQAIAPVVDGLVVALSGEDAATDAGGGVFVWNDRAAGGGLNDAVAGADGPTRVSVTMPSGTLHEVLDFDGVDDSLRLAADEDLDSNSLTWFTVLRSDDPAATDVVLRSSYDDRGDGQVNDKIWGTYLENGRYLTHSRTADGIMKAAVSDTVVGGDWVILSAVWDGETITQYINGLPSGSISGADAQPFFHLGTSVGAALDGGFAFDGQIAELLIYNTALNTNDHDVIFNFLRSKYFDPIAQLDGDLDGDGFVGITDLNIVLGAWNQSVPPGNPLADPSGDGFVGIEDLNIVLGNWNAGAPPTNALQSIPEPTSVVPMALAGLAGLYWRRWPGRREEPTYLPTHTIDLSHRGVS